MRIWPFGNKLETRAVIDFPGGNGGGYSDTLIAALVSRAQGRSLAIPSATAALEACAGLVGRGFMGAEVTGRAALVDALTPSVMELIGRSLIRTGEVVYLIDTTTGALRLIPAETWDVDGGPWPDTWTYRLTMGGPSRTYTMDFVPAASVLHFRYARDAARPWRGNGPIQVAALAGRLSAETANALGDESSGPVGRLLGIPTDGNDGNVESLKNDIRDAKGRTALMEMGDWDNSGSGGARVDLASKRFGAEPPASLVELADHATREIFAACGLSGALFGMGSANGASVREAWRLALFGVLAPLGRLVAEEMEAKLEDVVSIGWQELRASDLSGRARAFQSMVGGGVEVERAMAISGLMVDDGAE